jgi:COMPASS component SWD3
MELDKQQKLLKAKVELLERENIGLKKSLYELSTRYNAIAHKLQPFPLADILDPIDIIEPLAEMDDDLLLLKDRQNKVFSMKLELKGHQGCQSINLRCRLPSPIFTLWPFFSKY